MTYKELEDLVKSVQYKPNFKLDVMRSYDANNVELRFCMFALDAYKREDNVKYSPVLRRSTFPQESLKHFTKEGMIDRIFKMIKSQEIHEAQEWFLVDGKRIYDPHKEDVKNAV